MTIASSRWKISVLAGYVVGALALSLDVSAAHADARLIGDLPRTLNAPLESLPGVDTEYADFRATDGSRLRTIVTKPQGSSGRLPAIQFIQWLSCDTVEILPNDRSGWARMLSRLVTESKALVLRTEKAGVGDSQGGPCSALDYNSELEYHREALEKLAKRRDVDPEKIVVFGASIGATFAPLIASKARVAGVVVWGGGARTWYERQLAFDRRAMELSGRDLSHVSADMMRRAEFEWLYLQKRQTPESIARDRPELAGVWPQIVGAKDSLQYGRPFAFQWQAQQQDWAAAWSLVRAPVLVLIGEYDWYEDPRSAELIARIVNHDTPRSAEFHVIPGLNHHFSRFPNAEAAFLDQGGVPDPDSALEVLLPWIRQRLQ